MAVYYINGTSNSGATFGTSGYFYPLYLTAAEANSASDNTAGTSHAHTFEEAPNITFYMPVEDAAHAQPSAPSGSYSGEVYVSYTSPIAEEDVEEIGTGVLAGDTFNSWRKKTNDVARETIANKASIGSVDTRLTRLLSVTGGENNIMTLSSSDNITGEKEFEGLVKFTAADDLANAVQVGTDGKLYVSGSKFLFANDVDLHTAGAEIKASNLDLPTGKTKYAGVQYTWPSQAPIPGQILKSAPGNTLTWATETAAEANVEAFLIEDPNPIGSVLQWTTNTPPSKWLICDGTAVSRETYEDLFGVIGETYGAGDNINTFNLPDLRARVPVGKGTNSDANNLSAAFETLGSSQYVVNSQTLGGEYQHTLLESEMPQHHHFAVVNGFVTETGDVTASNAISENATQSGSTYQSYRMRPATTSTFGNVGRTSQTGSGDPHANVQPFIVLNYIIKAEASTIVEQNITPSNGILINDAAAQTNLLSSGSANTIKMDVDSNDFEFNGNQLKLKDDLSISVTTATFPDTTPTASESSVLTTTTQGLAFPFSEYFETTFVQPNASTATLDPIAHGLSGKPTFTYVTLECTSAEGGYSVGDEIPFNAPNNISNNHGPTLFFDSTHFKWKTYGNVYITQYTGGSVLAITYNKWKWRIKAWR